MGGKTANMTVTGRVCVPLPLFSMIFCRAAYAFCAVRTARGRGGGSAVQTGFQGLHRSPQFLQIDVYKRQGLYRSAISTIYPCLCGIEAKGDRAGTPSLQQLPRDCQLPGVCSGYVPGRYGAVRTAAACRYDCRSPFPAGFVLESEGGNAENAFAGYPHQL